jgi:hypothetical protein
VITEPIFTDDGIANISALTCVAFSVGLFFHLSGPHHVNAITAGATDVSHTLLKNDLRDMPD